MSTVTVQTDLAILRRIGRMRGLPKWMRAELARLIRADRTALRSLTI